jgi:glycine cleavage system aminomethyltransferase T
MVTNDLASLMPGQGCYAFILDATGHVLSDARVLCASDYLLLDVEPGMAAFVAETLDRYLIMERCRITDVSEEIGQVFVGGARAPEVLARLGAPDVLDGAEGQNGAMPIAGEIGLVAATRLISAPGFDIYLPEWRSTEGALLAELDAGTPWNCPPTRWMRTV